MPVNDRLAHVMSAAASPGAVVALPKATATPDPDGVVYRGTRAPAAQVTLTQNVKERARVRVRVDVYPMVTVEVESGGVTFTATLGAAGAKQLVGDLATAVAFAESVEAGVIDTLGEGRTA